jgi:hypothetical protein
VHFFGYPGARTAKLHRVGYVIVPGNRYLDPSLIAPHVAYNSGFCH